MTPRSPGWVALGGIAAMELAGWAALYDHADTPAVYDRLRVVWWALGLALGLWLARTAPATSTVPEPAPPPPPADAREARWLRTLLDGMSEAVVALDRDGRVAFANAAASGLLGLRALPIGTPMFVLEAVPRLRSSAVAAMHDDEVVVRELHVPGFPPRELLLRATPTEDGVVLMLLDLSGQRRMEAQRRRFVAAASHELRTPVAAIQLNLEALVEALEAPPQLRSRLTLASQRQADRLVRLVEDLSLLTRLDEGAATEIQPLPLAPVLAAARTHRDTFGADSADRVTWPDPSHAWVRGDRLLIRHVLDNLVANALRYSDDAVTVTVTEADERVLIEVADQGPGIPEAERARVFQRFYRTDEGRARTHGGTGLGLAIVDEAVQLMGGRVALLPNRPQGTVARVELPRVAAAVGAAEAAR